VLAINEVDLPEFAKICARERCLYAVVGEATEVNAVRVDDPRFDNSPINLPTAVLFGKTPKMCRDVIHRPGLGELASADRLRAVNLREAIYRVLRLPTVADKTFLITIGDRSVGGLTVRDQMVGPWQVPVADCAVTAADYLGYAGEAMAIGERTPAALLDAAAAARIAVGEALTNLAAAGIADTERVVLSANWMAAAGHPGEDAALYAAVQAVGMALCPALDITIPVGKDSLSMKTVWGEGESKRAVISPLSLIVSAFAPVEDIRRGVTPQLMLDRGETALLLVDLGQGRCRLGGSALAQVYSEVGDVSPDLDDAKTFRDFFRLIGALIAEGKILAYHDRSDGGLLATLAEMAFASRCGLVITLDGLGAAPVGALFNEELGAVLQVTAKDLAGIRDRFTQAGLGAYCHVLGQPVVGERVVFTWQGGVVLDEDRVEMHRAWSETSHAMQMLRDHPGCAKEEFDRLLDRHDSGLQSRPSFDMADDVAAPYLRKARPRVAILREQGVNGHVEMAAAYHRAGFEAVDVHMTDLLTARHRLSNFVGLTACGGFSYGDVLGAGGGWAMSVLHHAELKAQFAEFFARTDSFTLGVCNGCQMLSHLKDIIPGAEHWPRFVRNTSEQFEARLVMVEVAPSPSILFAGMAGSQLPVVVAHGEGRVRFDSSEDQTASQVCLRYVDHRGAPTQSYPYNPNGSLQGITGLTTKDGRATILMPHPERLARTVNYSWHPADWLEDGPWMRLFRNARAWVG